MSLRLAIDFDRTLVDGQPIRLRQGAEAALRTFKRAGHSLILHSARATPDGAAPVIADEAARFWQYGEVPSRTRYQWDLLDEMRTFLRATGLLDLFDEIWTSPGKPLVDRFIDDLAVPPDWATMRASLA